MSGNTDNSQREKGALVYPVYSRRSGGLSIGINLFPGGKLCSFDCPYCEVFPFSSAQTFSLSLMEQALSQTIAEMSGRGITIKDICFSGNGEPTLSEDFPAALEAAFRIRDMEAADAELVLITNGSGLLDEGLFDLLHRAADRGLRIWLKLDAGTNSWYKTIDRSAIPFERLTEKIRLFVKCAPVTLQTMICSINGSPPPDDEARAWEAFVAEISTSAKNLREVQIYGKARSAPEDPLASAVSETFLQARADSLNAVLTAAGKMVPVRVYP